MKIIRPEAITDAVLTASNVPETVAPYNPATEYDKDDVVLRASDHGLYESQVDGNVGQSLDDPAKWLRIAPTNRWAMFDEYNQTQTASAESIEVELDPDGRITGMALLNLDAASVTVVMTDDIDGEIYNQTLSLVDNGGIGNWYDYFFEPIIRKTDLVLTDLPVHFGPSIIVTIDAPGGTAKCGNLVIGAVRDFGATVYGAGLGIIDYSKKEADEYGNVKITARSYRKSGSFEVVTPRQLVDEVYRLLAQYRATPIVYVGTGEYASAAYFGFYRDANVVVEHAEQSTLNIQIEGLS